MTQKTIETKIFVFRFDELSEEFQNLVNKAKAQCENAYAPYSNFRVGAAILLENDEIVGGSNQENAAYPSGLCAERTAMFYANSQFPTTPIKALAIAAWTNGKFLAEPTAPCGACRQVLLETANRFHDFPVLLYGTDAVYMAEKSKDLLPLNFAKESLG